MKTVKININGKEVEIELTADQVADIKNKSYHYTDIKTLQDALDYTGESLESFNNRTQFDDDTQKAYKELEVIVEAIRQGNELGHEKGDYWYYPYFNAKRSSVGFSYDGSHFDATTSGVGSRLCLESSEKATYLGKQFINIYDRYINGDILSKENEIPFVVSPKTFTSYTDIKTFEDACIATGRTLKSFESEHNGKSDDSYAYEQLKVISKALNGNKHMDYSNTSEYKYYPWFHAVGSSSGFSFNDYCYDFSTSDVGSRLTYKSKEIAIYAGKQFIDIYNAWIN